MLRRCLKVATAEACACVENPLGLDAGRILARDEIRPHILRLHDKNNPLCNTTTGETLSDALTLFENGGSLQEVLSNIRGRRGSFTGTSRHGPFACPISRLGHPFDRFRRYCSRYGKCSQSRKNRIGSGGRYIYRFKSPRYDGRCYGKPRCRFLLDTRRLVVESCPDVVFSPCTRRPGEDCA